VTCIDKKAVSPDKDVGFFVDRSLNYFERLETWGTAMAEPSFIEFSLKDARSQKTSKKFW
jgi:hypothetical protein